MRTKTTIDRQVSETEKPASLAGFLCFLGGDGRIPDISCALRERQKSARVGLSGLQPCFLTRLTRSMVPCHAGYSARIGWPYYVWNMA